LHAPSAIRHLLPGLFSPPPFPFFLFYGIYCILFPQNLTDLLREHVSALFPFFSLRFLVETFSVFYCLVSPPLTFLRYTFYPPPCFLRSAPFFSPPLPSQKPPPILLCVALQRLIWILLLPPHSAPITFFHPFRGPSEAVGLTLRSFHYRTWSSLVNLVKCSARCFDNEIRFSIHRV